MQAFRPAATPAGADLPVWTTLALVLWFATSVDAASRFDPALRFRVLPTEHFLIYFHQDEERLARRLAAIAEQTWLTLERPLGVRPPPLTHVVLADQTEIANGYATPLPYDTIVLFTVWPAGFEYDFDDWLRLAFTHEFTHIVHLDRSEGWARLARGIFGRAPYAFPNVFLPTWQVEGLAVYEESVVTGEGRLHAGDFRAIVDEAARARRLEPLDRVNGGLTDWPAGDAPYAYGVGFHAYLVDRFGAESLARLATATSRRFPYTSTRAFLYVYGETLGDLWRDYEARVERETPAAASIDSTVAQLTHGGFTVAGPRFDRFACAGCPPEILYSVRNPDGFPALERLALDGTPPREMATRYFGSTEGVGRDAIYFDQTDFRRNVGLYADLYTLSRADRHVRQLTSGARLRDPDLSPDGTTLACTQDRAGQRDLVLVDTAVLNGRTASVEKTAGVQAAAARAPAVRPAVTTIVSAADVYFETPRWSPDGRTIAVARHRLGAMPDIVLVDVATGAIRVAAAEARTRFAMPAWRPDGAALVVAAAGADETFNLFEIAIEGSTRRQLTHVTGGALWPDVSPDGKTIVFAGYTTAGYDLFAMPYPPAGDLPERDRLTAMPDGSAVEREAFDRSSDSNPPTLAYSPLQTLGPTSWSPIVSSDGESIRVGAAAGGVDLLGYHGYAASASWLASAPAGAITPAAATPDWQVSYAYDRWRPTFYAAASSTTSFFAGPATDAGAATAATLRERTIEAGVVLAFLHARRSHAASVSVGRSIDDYTLAAGSLTRTRTPLRLSWQSVTAHTYGYSISREDGIFAGATAEAVRRAFDSSADATTLTADARVYLRGAAPHHVVALRASGGASIGDVTVGRTFLLGGSAADAGTADFGSRASSLLRGFADATFAGSRVALINAEYRWPIARPQRGVGTWPVFLHSVHAAVFADAGEAWTRAFDGRALKTSAGGELSANIIAGYFAPLTITVGGAWGHDRNGAIADRATAYFRVGKAF